MSPLERESHLRRVKFEHLLHCNKDEEEDEEEEEEEDYNNRRRSNASDQTTTTNSNDEDDATSSLAFSPWSQASSYTKSPWSNLSPPPMTRQVTRTRAQNNCGFTLMGSLVREDGHVYSLAVRGGTLYTGSNSKNIRVWKNFRDAGGFKSASGFVKAIIVAKDERLFTAHHDGKVRVWTRNGKRVGTLPKLKDFLKCSINPNNYVEVRRRHKVPKIKHYDAVSCLALNEEAGLLYSGSWDKSIKVWRVNDFKCLESINNAHDDAINAVVVGFEGLVFSGSADGMLKVWRRDTAARGRHVHARTLMKGDHAVTSLAVAEDGGGSSGGGGGGVLYGGSSDGLVRFWEDEEEMVYGGVLRGHKMAVLCLATAGCLVISGSADRSVCIWRREGGLHSCLAVLTGHCGPVKCLAVEEDHYDDNDDGDDDCDDHGRRWIVYSGSLDKSVRIWRVIEHAANHDDDST